MELLLFPCQLLRPGWQGLGLCSSPAGLRHGYVAIISAKTKYIFNELIKIRLLRAILSHLKKEEKEKLPGYFALLSSLKSKPNLLRLAAPKQYHQHGWRWWSRHPRSRIELKLQEISVCFHKDRCVKSTEWWAHPAALFADMKVMLSGTPMVLKLAQEIAVWAESHEIVTN